MNSPAGKVTWTASAQATGSCIAKRVERYVSLAPHEVRALKELESQEHHFPRKSCIRSEGDPSTYFYVLKEGWVSCSTLLEDGRRQITRLHFAGDMMGMPSLVMARAVDTLTALTSVTVSTFDRTAIGRLFAEHPRLAAILFLSAQNERVRLIDRIMSIARTSAASRIAAVLIQIRDRLRENDPTVGSTFLLPLSQAEIADMTGLTPVHVNRMLTAMVGKGLLLRSRGRVTIVDEEALAALAELPVRDRSDDIEWLPPQSDPGGAVPEHLNTRAKPAAAPQQCRRSTGTQLPGPR